MRWFLTFAWLLFSAAALGQSIEGGGGLVVTPPIFVPQSASYSGPGDIVSSAQFWYSCQFAYNAAIAAAATQPTCNLRRASDNHTCDVIIATSGSWGNTNNCSTGGDDGQSASAFCNATTCSVTKAYDQTVGLNCSGATCDISQSTAADQPTITFSAVGTSAAMKCSQASSQGLIATNGFSLATSTIFTMSAVSEFTGSSQGPILAALGGYVQVGSGIAGGDYFLYQGAVLEVTAAASAFHAVQAVFLGSASTTAYIDGASSTGSAGSNSSPTEPFAICTESVNYWQGYVGEAGLWLPAFSAGQQSSMNTNQHSRWGF